MLSFDKVVNFFRNCFIFLVAVFTIMCLCAIIACNSLDPDVYMFEGIIIDIKTDAAGARTMIVEADDGNRVSATQIPANTYNLLGYQREDLYQTMITSIVGDKVRFEYVREEFINGPEYRPVSFKFLNET